jgi:hypothetical protein
VPSAGRRSRTTNEARLVERFKRLAPQQQALQFALTPFHDDSGRPDRRRWVKSFESDRPQDIVEIKAVTGLYEGLVNHLAEMLFVAAKLRGLAVVQHDVRPSGPQLFDAVGDDDGLTDSQVTVLKRLYAMRNELQHASPGVEAGQVFDDVQMLLKTLKRFVSSYIAWLKQHGISLV